VDEGVSARADKDSNKIGSGEVSGSMERSGITAGLESDKLLSFWPTLDCLFRD
jgi:hypothetical protein